MAQLYHYTTLEALLGIIQKNQLCFWGSRYDTMNDPTDFIYARDHCSKFFHSRLKSEETNYNIENLKKIIPYIVSFSKKKDDFNMWRLYHAEVAIVLNGKVIEEKCQNKTTRIKEVRYATLEEGEKAISKQKPLIVVCDILTTEMEKQGKKLCGYDLVEFGYLEAYPFVKDEAYEIEEEVRLVHLDNPKHTVKSEEESNIKCRGIRNGMLLLYKEFILPKEALKKIIIRTHDIEYFQKIKEQLRIVLLDRGFNSKVSIEQTKTPQFRAT